jgi:hypothetical protein
MVGQTVWLIGVPEWECCVQTSSDDMCVIEGRETRDYVRLFWSHPMREGRREQGTGGYYDNRPVPYAPLRGGPGPGDNGTCMAPASTRNGSAIVAQQYVVRSSATTPPRWLSAAGVTVTFCVG